MFKNRLIAVLLSLLALSALPGCNGGTQTPPDAPAEAATPAGDSDAVDHAEPEPPAPDSAASDQPQPDAAAPRGEDRDALLAAYREALTDLYLYQKFPGDLQPRDFYSNPEENYFAVCDIDGDGADELILQYCHGGSAGHAEAVYGYDSGSGTLKEELMEYPLITYYDNGAAKALWSHNQGLAGESFWPYTVYQYDAASDTYQLIGYADAWDRSLSDTGRNGDPFPADIDVSGTGTVYYLSLPDSSEASNPVDVTEYDAWVDSWQQGAGEIAVPYQALTQENIDSIA